MWVCFLLVGWFQSSQGTALLRKQSLGISSTLLFNKQKFEEMRKFCQGERSDPANLFHAIFCQISAQKPPSEK